MSESRIILPICPQTYVKFKSGKGGDQVLKYIPEKCVSKDKVTGKLKDKGKPCKEWLTSGGICPHTLSQAGRYRKRRLDKYSKYRMDVFHLAKHEDFKLPMCGWSIYFYFPMPKRWSKKKKMEMQGQMHQQKPDIDNLCKAVFDSLSTRDEDISQLSGMGKFWIYPDKVEDRFQNGYIEILIYQPLYNPFDVTFINPYKMVTMASLAEQRQVRELQKEKARIKRKEDKKSEAKPVRRNPKPVKLLPQSKLFRRENVLK